jgi:predicted nucleic acid-binding protein
VTETGIPDGSTIAVDTTAFIYYLEQNPKYLPLATELFQQMENGRTHGFASVLVLTELLVPYLGQGDALGARRLSSAIRSIVNLKVLPVDVAVAERAARLRSSYGLRTPDALHLASGLEQGAEWFVTNDVRLKRVEDEGLRIWLFDEHVVA